MVPKTIHIITGPKTTALIDRCLKSWKVMEKSGFELRYWDDELIVEFISENYPFALNAILNARNHAEVADISRYAIIYHFGGYYVDWDIELLDEKLFLSLHQKNKSGYLIQDPLNMTLASEAFSAGIKEKFLLMLVENIIEIYENGFRHSMETPYYSGPFRMREVYYFTKEKSTQTIINVKDIFLYDYQEIREMPEREVNVPMIHYWNHSWFTKPN